MATWDMFGLCVVNGVSGSLDWTENRLRLFIVILSRTVRGTDHRSERRPEWIRSIFGGVQESEWFESVKEGVRQSCNGPILPRT